MYMYRFLKFKEEILYYNYGNSITHFSVDPTTILNHLNGPQPFIEITLNEFCRSDREYTVIVSFGVLSSGGVCQVAYNESIDVVPGETVTFLLNTEIIQGQEYCANVIVNSAAGFMKST